MEGVISSLQGIAIRSLVLMLVLGRLMSGMSMTTSMNMKAMMTKTVKRYVCTHPTL